MLAPSIFFFLQCFRNLLNVHNSLPNNKILDKTKSKAFADYKLNVVLMTIPFFDIAENNEGKGEIFPFSHIVFKAFFLSHSHTMTPFDAPGKQAF